MENLLIIALKDTLREIEKEMTRWSGSTPSGSPMYNCQEAIDQITKQIHELEKEA